MTGGASTPVLAGLGVGIALASAPGPIQAVLLAETLRGGISRGLRAQAGVNVAFAVLLVCLAFGLSVVVPGGWVLAVLQAVGGLLLILLAAEGIRSASRQPQASQTAPAAAAASRAAPARGALAAVLNPGTWLFLGAVAAPLFGSALRRGGTGDALLVALVILVGCACGDSAVVLIGGFGVRRASQRGRQWVQRGLATILAGLGCWFLIAGTAALTHL